MIMIVCFFACRKGQWNFILSACGTAASPFLGPVPYGKTSKKHHRKGGVFYGALEGTRTPDLLVRSQLLYPTELPAHFLLLKYISTFSGKCQPLFLNFLNYFSTFAFSFSSCREIFGRLQWKTVAQMRISTIRIIAIAAAAVPLHSKCSKA